MARRKAGGGTALIVTGDKEIDRLLRSVEPKLQRKAVRQAMRKGMKIITTEAKQQAPVDTGLTRRSIKTRAGKRKRNVISIETRIGEGDFKGETFYASFLEFGAPKRGLEPRPFMKPAYEREGEKARDVAMEALKEGLESVVGGKLRPKITKSKRGR